MNDNAFIGRRDKLAEMFLALENSMSNKGGGLLIRGVSGIGKSALLAEFASQAIAKNIDNPPIVLHSKCLPVLTDGSAYYPFVSMIKQELDPSLSFKSKVADFVYQVAPEWLELIPVAGQFLKAGTKTGGWMMKELISLEQTPERLHKQYISLLIRLAVHFPGLF